MSNTEKVTLEELSDDTTSLSSHNSLSSNTNNNNNNNEVIIKTDSGGGDGGGTSKSNSFDHEFMLDHQNYSSTYQPRGDYYRLNTYPNVNDYLFDNGIDITSSSSTSNSKMCCLECGSYTYLIKCNSHCELMLCEQCQQKHWQMEINELIKLKTDLENNVADLRVYLAARRSQSIENVKSSQQLKKFITMTMQQIKRKVELELENKRDELYSSIDQFVENQKKYNIIFV